MNYYLRFATALLILIFSCLATYCNTNCNSNLSPAQVAEQIRGNLVEIQLVIGDDKEQASELLAKTAALYEEQLASSIKKIYEKQGEAIARSLGELSQAVSSSDNKQIAILRAHIWVKMLAVSYQAVEEAIKNNDGKNAKEWLRLREFRKSTRFSRPNADATLAVDKLIQGQITPQEALEAVRADLLDTYQARFMKVLQDLSAENATLENAYLASGYFDILANSYIEQQGSEEYTSFQDKLQQLTQSSSTEELNKHANEISKLVAGFRAAPLTESDKQRRVGQLQRFLMLVPIEYGRGVRDGQVYKDFEIQEAVTFLEGAESAFTDIKSYLTSTHPTPTKQIEDTLIKLRGQLHLASQRTDIVDPDLISSQANSVLALLKEITPPEWQKRSMSGDFDAIAAVLDQMENAIAQGEYQAAETARLEAYAILDTGPEAKLIAFAPQFIPQLEQLFWYGSSDQKGLGKLIEEQAPLSEIRKLRIQLNEVLNQAQKALGNSNSSPTAVATNAAIIVFREGLEAVLIIAAMLAGFHREQYQHLRKPLLWGVFLAFLATLATWFLAQEILLSLAHYGERLEAIISLIAVILLLLITNWFFHKSYWVGWLQGFQSKKWGIASSRMGQITGMILLGFDSVYREGFETVLFLQALVLEAGVEAVMLGVAAGFALVVAIGFVLFKIQVKLPYKKMLIVTGVLIVTVLVTMVGGTVHSFQVVGWLPTHPIREITLPYWTGLWFGLFATWEGIILQFSSAAFVLGSYFLANFLNKRKKND